MVKSDIILDFQNVTKTFPGVVALDDVSIQVERGEIHGICGENGAGKSTLMKILSGVHSHETYDGKVMYEGEELILENRAIHEAGERGIAIVYQELTLVPAMTVGENIFLGKEPKKNGAIDWNKLYSETSAILKKYSLEIEPQAIVKHLGVGKQQMVEMAKALAENAKVLILDEPTSALTEHEIDKLMEILKLLKSHGVTCIYITHKLEEFFRITDRITVLRDGKTIVTKPTNELDQENLVKYMVGREMHERFPKKERNPGEVFFRVEGLKAVDPDETSREVVKDVSFDLRKGEILGIAGLMGSGRTELVTTLFGEFGNVVDGKIFLDDKQITINSSREAIQYGISLVPEDRKGMGLVLIQTILNNISLPNLDQFSRFMRIDANAELNASRTQAKNLAIKTPSLHAPTYSLSGGNQQKVVIAKWLMSEPKILIMDDPTRGIDVGAKYEIYKLMNELTDQGVSIIMISSELEEVLGMSDRVMVMHEGHSAGTLDIKDATQEKIMSMATGIG
ncbi:MAG: ATP-binding cassette domain-containing protein [Anaerolineales bacterium]|nr:ATP-binding cassette domain-containing protein [Anaerolineales bacterium]